MGKLIKGPQCERLGEVLSRLHAAWEDDRRKKVEERAAHA